MTSYVRVDVWWLRLLLNLLPFFNLPFHIFSCCVCSAQCLRIAQHSVGVWGRVCRTNRHGCLCFPCAFVYFSVYYWAWLLKGMLCRGMLGGSGKVCLCLLRLSMCLSSVSLSILAWWRERLGEGNKCLQERNAAESKLSQCVFSYSFFHTQAHIHTFTKTNTKHKHRGRHTLKHGAVSFKQRNTLTCTHRFFISLATWRAKVYYNLADRPSGWSVEQRETETERKGATQRPDIDRKRNHRVSNFLM